MIINGTDIEMIRGDSETITISMERDEEPVCFQQGDTLYFTVKENIRRREDALQKIVTDFTEEGKAVIKILPEDTKNLRPKDDYIYDVQLTEKDGTVTTIVPPSRFSLIGDVTHD